MRRGVVLVERHLPDVAAEALLLELHQTSDRLRITSDDWGVLLEEGLPDSTPPLLSASHSTVGGDNSDGVPPAVPTSGANNSFRQCTVI